MRAWNRWIGALFCAVGAAACGADVSDDAPPAVAVADSAGIAIAVVSADAAGNLPGWTLADDPTVRIGTLDGPEETQLFRVRGGTVLSDGRIVVLNAGTQELRYFDPNGNFLFAVGSRGDGPEEFQALTYVGRMRGDSVAVYDSRHLRHAVYGPDGTVGRTRTLASTAAFRRPLGHFPNGDLLMRVDERWSGETEPGPYRPDMSVIRLSAERGEEIGLVTLPAEQGIFHRHSGIFTARQLTFGRASFAAVTGREAARSVTGSSDTYEFRFYDGDMLSRIVRVEADLAPVEPGRFDFIRDSVLGTSGGEDTRAFWRSLYEAMPRLDTYPAYEGLRGDTQGNVWIKQPARPGAHNDTWTVFGPEGMPLATIRLPPELDLLELGGDYVLGVEEDELETEFVVRYPLRQ